jgi:hypothetical protein
VEFFEKKVKSPWDLVLLHLEAQRSKQKAHKGSCGVAQRTIRLNVGMVALVCHLRE